MPTWHVSSSPSTSRACPGNRPTSPRRPCCRQRPVPPLQPYALPLCQSRARTICPWRRLLPRQPLRLHPRHHAPPASPLVPASIMCSWTVCTLCRRHTRVDPSLIIHCLLCLYSFVAVWDGQAVCMAQGAGCRRANVAGCGVESNFGPDSITYILLLD